MAWRISNSVVRGEIDNRMKGRIEGRIWLAGLEQPLTLQLKGNCLRDMAGRVLTFENPHPVPDIEQENLYPEQTGVTGDMTASRKVRVFDVPLKEVHDLLKLGIKPPESMSNSIYLEWYSDRNGRVVIESADYTIAVSERVWKMTEPEEQTQRENNAQTAVDWIDRLTQATEPALPETDGKDRPDPDTNTEAEPMDEFAWERFLKKSDARTDHLMRLEEKYADLSPEDRERAIAREMGWTQIEDFLDAAAKGELPDDEDVDDPFDDLNDPEPDPATEGIDWVRSEVGHPVHPLCKKCSDIHFHMRQDCQQAGYPVDEPDSPICDMLFCGHMVGSKLAGALNSLWMGHTPQPGFIVAYLKRALTFYNEGMAHWQKVMDSGKVEPARLIRYRDDIFSVREDILRLMNHYRNSNDM